MVILSWCSDAFFLSEGLSTTAAGNFYLLYLS
jgi:hypothetical protein